MTRVLARGEKQQHKQFMQLHESRLLASLDYLVVINGGKRTGKYRIMLEVLAGCLDTLGKKLVKTNVEHCALMLQCVVFAGNTKTSQILLKPLQYREQLRAVLQSLQEAKPYASLKEQMNETHCKVVMLELSRVSDCPRNSVGLTSQSCPHW